MLRSRSLTLIAVLLIAPAVGAQSYTIKLKHYPDAGKGVTVKDSETEKGTLKETDPDNKVLKDVKGERIVESVYVETVLESGDRTPKKYKRTYEKATRSIDGKATATSYEGKTIVFELKDGKYAVTAEGDAKIKAEDLAELTRKADESNEEALEKLLLPKKAVKVGETWTVDAKELAKEFGGEEAVDTAKSKFEGVLSKAYEKDGKQWGVIELTIKLVPKLPKEVKALEDPLIEMKLVLDSVIDGSGTGGILTTTGKTGSRVEVEEKGVKSIIESRSAMSGKQERSAEK